MDYLTQKEHGLYRSTLQILSGAGATEERLLVTEFLGDKKRIELLEKLQIENKYSEKCILRQSTTGRGWRLLSTTWKGCVATVREAIDNYMEIDQ